MNKPLEYKDYLGLVPDPEQDAIQLEKEEDMRRRGIRSPDEWDAIALTFAEPVSDDKPVEFSFGGRGFNG